MTVEDADRVLVVLSKARALALQTGRKVRVLQRRSVPTRYGWNGWRATTWTVKAYPDGRATLELRRVVGPANDKSFNGEELQVEGVNPRDLLWRAGLQRLRVVPFNDDTIQALKVFALLLALVLIVSSCGSL